MHAPTDLGLRKVDFESEPDRLALPSVKVSQPGFDECPQLASIDRLVGRAACLRFEFRQGCRCAADLESAQRVANSDAGGVRRLVERCFATEPL